ncbi:metallophosphoesterase [Nocardioides sp.]|uniref:metallophosphoesterase n=1 Tax=Nocardioides sp. TaxID=35761 RepID=UPI0039E4E693
MSRPVARLLLLVLAAFVATAAAAAARPAGRVLDDNGSKVGYTVVGGGRILVSARATRCLGFAKLRIRVDGRLDRTVRMKATGKRVYRSARSYADGTHQVKLVLRADRSVKQGRARKCDRTITILGVTTSGGSGQPTTDPGTDPATTHSAAGDTAFTLAVLGDTQSEVLSPTKTTFATRTSWLAAHRQELDLRFVAHTGDLVNWGWLVPAQFDMATAAMATLTTAGLPWQVAVGNHDTAAVGWDGQEGSRGYGGSAYQGNPECAERFGDDCKTWLLVRNTDAFNSRISASDEGAVAETFEGKLENSYSTFEAAGHTWLVLNVELWPRQEALTWAAGVLAAHPDDNVIILTHSYLTADGSLAGNGGYGALPATEIYNQLVARYANVKLVFSGHEGVTAERIDTPGGRKVAAFLGNETGGVGVTRLVDIDAANGVVSTRWWAGTADLDSSPTGTSTDAGFDFD